MATMRMLPSGRFNAVIRRKGKPTISKTFDSQEEAEAWIAKEDVVVFNPNPPMSDFIPAYLNEVMKRGGKKRGGYESVKHSLQNLSEHFPQDLNQITTPDVYSFMLSRLQECKPGSVRLQILAFRRFLLWAELRGFLLTGKAEATLNPIKLPKASPPRQKVLTESQVEELIQITSPMMASIFLIGYETALRRCEILMLKPSMINFERKVITLRDGETKNEEGRLTPMSSRVCEHLKISCDGKGSDELLFNVKPQSVSQAFRRAYQKLDITDVCFHSLRHTCITRYAKKQMNTAQLKIISGHKSVAMLERYCHLDAEDVAKLMD